MTEMPLDKYFHRCPRAWKNFIDYAQTLHADWNGTTAPQHINAELCKYGGTYHSRGELQPGKVVFNSDYALSHFLLRWS